MNELKRICGACEDIFYCSGECKIKIKLSQIGACFCPKCAKKHKIAVEGQQDYCETRFGENATALIPFTKEKVLFT